MLLSASGLTQRSDYGQRWGEGAARCFSIQSDLDEEESVRLMPIPECFICPLSQAPMEDPVVTVDGFVYERAYIEHWIRHRQQQRLPVTSPATNQELPSHRLISLSALQRAIEAYLAHRPELHGTLTAGRSFEEAAQMLQSDLLDKQTAHASTEDECSLLRDSNEVLYLALQNSEKTCCNLRSDLEKAQAKVRDLEIALRAADLAKQSLEERTKFIDDHCRNLKARLQDLEQSTTLRCSDCSFRHSVALAAELASSLPTGTAVCEPHRGGGMHSAVCVTRLPPGSKNVIQALDRSGSRLAVVVLIGLFLGLLVLLRGLLWANLPTSQGTKTSSNLQERFEMLITGNSSRLQQPAGDRRKPDLMLGARWKRKIDRQYVPSISGIAYSVSDGEFSRADKLPLGKLVAQLRSGTLDEKMHAALGLGILATASPENQVAIVRTGAVVPLVDLLSADLPEVRGQAAVALKALAANSTYNKVVIVRCGAITPLIRLVKEDTFEVQEVAAAALQTLAETSNQVEIAQAGAIVPLVALLKDERPRVREEAAGALVMLALNADNQVAIAQVGAIPLLIDLLKDDVPEVREQAAAALRNLAADNLENEVETARAGAFTPLAELLKDALPSVREEAARALRNLARNSPGDTLVVAEAAAVAARLAIKDTATMFGYAATTEQPMA